MSVCLSVRPSVCVGWFSLMHFQATAVAAAAAAGLQPWIVLQAGAGPCNRGREVNPAVAVFVNTSQLGHEGS